MGPAWLSRIVRQYMRSRGDNLTNGGIWLAFAIHTALIFLAAPIAYWTFICLENLPLHFGMVVSAAVGLPASYLIFGLPLLVVGGLAIRRSVAGRHR